MHFTAISPSKDHVLHPTFYKTPLKNTSKNNKTPAHVRGLIFFGK